MAAGKFWIKLAVNSRNPLLFCTIMTVLLAGLALAANKPADHKPLAKDGVSAPPRLGALVQPAAQPGVQQPH
jgi:hypothetical protein